MTDAVIIHLAAAVRPGIDVCLPRHRLSLRRDHRDQGRGGGRVPGQAAQHHPVAHREGAGTPRWAPGSTDATPDLCCYLRKVEPLERGADQLRRLDHRGAQGTRPATAARPRSWSGTTGGRWSRSNPIVSWSQKQVGRLHHRAGRAGETRWSTTGTRRSAAPPARSASSPAPTRAAAGGAGTGKTECGLHAVIAYSSRWRTGSADPRASATIAELAAGGQGALARSRPAHRLPGSRPRRRCLRSWATIEADREVTVLPLLLTAAYHSKADIPRVLAQDTAPAG